MHDNLGNRDCGTNFVFLDHVLCLHSIAYEYDMVHICHMVIFHLFTHFTLNILMWHSSALLIFIDSSYSSTKWLFKVNLMIFACCFALKHYMQCKYNTVPSNKKIMGSLTWYWITFVHRLGTRFAQCSIKKKHQLHTFLCMLISLGS